MTDARDNALRLAGCDSRSIAFGAEHPTAIDNIVLPGNEIRFIRCQEKDEASELFGFARPA